MNKKVRGPMAFYHEKGFVPAFKQASKFAGKSGHVGIMPDVVAARLANAPHKEPGLIDASNPSPWDRYYTTLTAEYFGVLRGRTSIIVAHGIGPMSTLQGILDAYRYEFDDKMRNNRGGRISQAEFEKLARGEYGDVSIIDFEEYRNLFGDRHYRSPDGYRRASDASRDPLLIARLGPQAHEYIACHAALARKYYQKEMSLTVEDPYILEVDGPNNLPYWCREVEPGMAFAHLTSVGCISIVQQGGKEHPMWACDVGIHEWWNGVRLLGVRAGSTSTVVDGPNAHKLLRKHWQELLEPSGITELNGFFALVEMPDKVWFTQVDKAGEGMDTYEPEFRVLSIEPMGEPVRFSTGVRHYHGFFKYGKTEVQAVMPSGANAYALVGEPENVWEGGNPVRQTCLAQPYRVVIDPTKRLVRQDALANDYDRMMQLLAVA